MSDSDSKEPLSDVSNSSFVILGLASVSDEGQSECVCNSSHSDLSVNQKSSSSPDPGMSGDKESNCCSSWSQCGSSIQEKLNVLLRENYQLKETLNQNNLAIKSQLDTFFMWQQEVLKTHETHKQKFLETRDLILKLRSENLSLKKQLDELSSGSLTATAASCSAETNKISRGGENQTQGVGNCDLDNKKEFSIENQKLSDELEEAKKEILRLKKELEEVRTENLCLKTKIDCIQENPEESTSNRSLPNAEARAQISNLFKQLEEEKGKTRKLKEALQKAETSNKESSDSKLSITDELNRCSDKLEDMNRSLDLQNQRFSGLNSWVSLAEENLKGSQVSEGVECNLLCEMKEFKSHLNIEENAFKAKQEAVQELKSQFTRLLAEYKALQQQLNSLSSESQDIKKYKEEIKNLSAELETKNEELASKQQECDRIKEEFEKSKLEWNEKINILRVQAELYENDFYCDQDAREKLVKEKEELEEEVRLLQSEFRKLGTPTSVGNGRRVKSPLESPGKEPTYVCPKCMASFSNLRRCEEHYESCLDIHLYP